jgi:hypothetical protein
LQIYADSIFIQIIIGDVDTIEVIPGIDSSRTGSYFIRVHLKGTIISFKIYTDRKLGQAVGRQVDCGAVPIGRYTVIGILYGVF